MTSFRKFCTTLAVVAVGVGALPALAQDMVRPRSGSSNTASNDLRTIYREDVGTGFTTQSLNQVSLANARAQVGNYGQSSYTQRYSPQGGRIPTLAGGSSAAKPFAQVGSSPAVSPYLNLFRDDFDGGGDFNYQTLVRPQFQQLATNQQFQRQNNELSQRVQSISAQGAFQNPAGSESQYPTGHQTAYGYFGTYYPGMPRPRGK